MESQIEIKNATRAFIELMGREFTDIKGRVAIDKLLEEKQGHVKDAFYREDIGGIDIYWGDERSGLCHILMERDKRKTSGKKFVRRLPDVIERGDTFPNVDFNRLNISYRGKVAIISFELYETETTALLTAFYTKKDRSPGEG